MFTLLMIAVLIIAASLLIALTKIWTKLALFIAAVFAALVLIVLII